MGPGADAAVPDALVETAAKTAERSVFAEEEAEARRERMSSLRR